jgi:hypothetical protein
MGLGRIFNYLSAKSRKELFERAEKNIQAFVNLLNNNYQKILGISDDANEVDDDQQKRKPIFIRKYTGNGILPLHESVASSSFLHLGEDYKPQYTPTIKSANKIFYPLDTTDAQNPLPYIFGSAAFMSGARFLSYLANKF